MKPLEIKSNVVLVLGFVTGFIPVYVVLYNRWKKRAQAEAIAKGNVTEAFMIMMSGPLSYGEVRTPDEKGKLKF